MSRLREITKLYLWATLYFLVPLAALFGLMSRGHDRYDHSDNTGGLSAIYLRCTGDECP